MDSLRSIQGLFNIYRKQRSEFATIRAQLMSFAFKYSVNYIDSYDIAFKHNFTDRTAHD